MHYFCQFCQLSEPNTWWTDGQLATCSLSSMLGPHNNYWTTIEDLATLYESTSDSAVLDHSKRNYFTYHQCTDSVFNWTHPYVSHFTIFSANRNRWLLIRFLCTEHTNGCVCKYTIQQLPLTVFNHSVVSAISIYNMNCSKLIHSRVRWVYLLIFVNEEWNLPEEFEHVNSAVLTEQFGEWVLSSLFTTTQ